ncbi:hypothetical protein D7147_04385 [Micromonospora musae]|uniref:Co-chaperone DjlA N-terminal domain-containing protein n=1 Tax=Micromonospora musae TaxID=1894970 RepID=A0ABX9RH69_9ACTN|nr:hypothetical protein [Micromonospora musae]RKN21993.1 hypothetical protein D7147_04385 [Micromonospora musae]
MEFLSHTGSGFTGAPLGCSMVEKRRTMVMTGPATLIGAFLRASVQNQKAERDELRASLIATRWCDAGGVIDEAFAGALREKFGEQPSLHQIRKFTLRFFWTYKSAKRICTPEQVELTLRWGVGEKVSLDQIDGRVLEAVKMLALAAVVADLELSPSELDELLAQAERRAYVTGYRATLRDQPLLST